MINRDCSDIVKHTRHSLDMHVDQCGEFLEDISMNTKRGSGEDKETERFWEGFTKLYIGNLKVMGLG